MQADTRTLLRTGLWIFATGAVAVLAIFTVLGGMGKGGPYTNSGWLALVLAMGCLPTGILTLALAFMKLFADRHR